MYRIALLLIGCALVGCASIDTTRGAPSDRDPVQQYQAPYQQVVRATRESLPILGFHIRQDQELSDVEHVMIAERSAHGASWGELVRVTLLNKGGKVEARVFTEPRFLSDFSADWDLSPGLFWQIDQELQQQGAMAAGEARNEALMNPMSP
jgi:hypothetical protein